MQGRIDFAALNNTLRPQLPTLIPVWLPDGRREGRNGLRSTRRGRIAAPGHSA